MIFENEKEKIAFEFMADLASEFTSRRGCNDLEQDMVEKFEGLTVPIDDNGTIIKGAIRMDFQVCHWLKLQIREELK